MLREVERDTDKERDVDTNRIKAKMHVSIDNR